jgi:alanyl-tRNA synthetase
MQYRREADGTFSPLQRRTVDFGGGLERIAAAALGVPDVYAVSVLAPLIRIVEDLSDASYALAPAPMRVIVDHVRGAYFLAVDGVRPGNKERGYVLPPHSKRRPPRAQTVRGQNADRGRCFPALRHIRVSSRDHHRGIGEVEH